MSLLVATAAAGAAPPAAAGPTTGGADARIGREHEERESAFQRFLEDDASAFRDYVARIEQQWNEFRDSTSREWVDYDPAIETRSTVNFETGTVTIDALVDAGTPQPEQQARQQLAGQLGSILAERDPVGRRILEHQVAAPGTDSTLTENDLPVVRDQIGKTIPVRQERLDSQDGTRRIRFQITLELVPDHLRIRAQRYLPLVRTYAAIHHVEAPLVMAIIHTESYFNPRAKSTAGAYGLMQLVPEYGARDAYRFVHGRNRTVTPSYLYDPRHNIELGTAYLHVLAAEHFARFEGAKRRYLVIAAYNWGPASVSKRIVEPNHLDQLSSDQVYRLLQRTAPHETRDYVQKVDDRRRLYGAR